MSLKSMTGFGRGEASANGWKVEAEVSSVNRKQFDVRVSLPRALAVLESRVHARVHGAVARGSVSVQIRVSRLAEGAASAIRTDPAAARAYLREFRRLAKTLGIEDDLTLSALIAQPGVVLYESVPEDTERVWKLVEKALKSALNKLLAMRRAEGRALQEDLARRLDTLDALRDAIRRAAPGTVRKRAQALRSRLRDLGEKGLDDDPALRRELALFAERVDISEELTRLASHIRQARSFLRQAAPAGRALDFVCQEMLREINTIGSKASDTAVSRHVIRFKAELERVREQVQNVE